MANEKNWLNHLKYSIPEEAFGYPVTMYSIALEGWRRGLSLKFVNGSRFKRAGIEYVLSSGKNTHRFIGCRSRIITRKAIKICINKDLTKEYLINAGVPVAEGKVFRKESSIEEMLKYAEQIGYPIVLKPTNGEGGQGVIANILTEKALKDAILLNREELGYNNLIIEKHFEGEDYRLFVIGNEVAGVVRRIPANVIGNGKSTIRELIRKKEAERDKNPALHGRPIRIDNETREMLDIKGYTLDSIPINGERVLLKSKNNISAGGDPIDATNDLPNEIKEYAVKAVENIPGLHQAGVDILYNKSNNSAIVIEVNTQPSIRTHLFPMEGQARDIPKKIIDYYFPETKETNIEQSTNYYFDIETVFETFQSGIIKEIRIPNIPKGELEITRFRLSGKLRNVKYENWVQNKARNLNLSGYIKHLKNGETSIVVAGPIEGIDTFREIITNEAPGKAVIDNIVEKSRTRPVKIGFEIK